jgi:hypothetical protein
MIKNIFTVAPMLVKLLGSMAHNVHGFVQALEFRQPVTAAKCMDKSSLCDLLPGAFRLPGLQPGYVLC